MIIDAILFIASAVVFLLLQILSLITLAIPLQIALAIQYFINYLGYIKGFFDVTTFLTVVGIYIDFLIAFYTWNIIRWVYGHLPWIGKKHEIPKDKKVGAKPTQS